MLLSKSLLRSGMVSLVGSSRVVPYGLSVQQNSFSLLRAYSTDGHSQTASSIDLDVNAVNAILNESYRARNIDQDSYLSVPVESLYDTTPVRQILLHPFIFAAPHRPDVLHQAVVYYRAKIRKGTSKGKRRGEVKGSTRKVRPQKGTGRSRAGDIRMPHWVGGGRAHPPTPRSFAIKLNRKVKNLAMSVALSAKLSMGDLHIMDELYADSEKTKPMLNHLLDRELLLQKPNSSRKDATTTLLFAAQTPCRNFPRSISNIPNVNMMSPQEVEVYHILRHKKLVVTPSVINQLQLSILNDGDDDAFKAFLQDESQLYVTE